MSPPADVQVMFGTAKEADASLPAPLTASTAIGPIETGTSGAVWVPSAVWLANTLGETTPATVSPALSRPRLIPAVRTEPGTWRVHD